MVVWRRQWRRQQRRRWPFVLCALHPSIIPFHSHLCFSSALFRHLSSIAWRHTHTESAMWQQNTSTTDVHRVIGWFISIDLIPIQLANITCYTLSHIISSSFTFFFFSFFSYIHYIICTCRRMRCCEQWGLLARWLRPRQHYRIDVCTNVIRMYAIGRKKWKSKKKKTNENVS